MKNDRDKKTEHGIDELMQLSCNELSDRTSIKALMHSSFVTLTKTIHF